MKKNKKVKAQPWPFPVDVPGRPWWGLYSGDGIVRETNELARDFAGPEASVLVLGPPRSGKTSSIVIPSVLDAPAAVVSTSTKDDVLAATLSRRSSLGRCWVFDPTATIQIPALAHQLRWSPVTGCHQWDQAVSMAHHLASAARPHGWMGESAHWLERAEALLAPLLYAADFRMLEMPTLCSWVLTRDLDQPIALLAEARGWDRDAQLASTVLSGVAATDERERSGIFSTAAGLLAAYRSQAALDTTTGVNFFPHEFVKSTDTIYVCAPSHAQEQLAPLIVALLEQIRSAVYARPKGAAPVVFALDEVAGIAPLPSLPALAAEGGGQGLVTLACLQDLSQARARWGESADGWFSIFNRKIVFPGIGDQRTLNLIASLAGEVQVQVRSHTNRPTSSTTTSVTWRPRLPPDEISRGVPGQALCLTGSSIATRFTISWWNHPLWAKVAEEYRPRWSERFRPFTYEPGFEPPSPL